MLLIAFNDIGELFVVEHLNQSTPPSKSFSYVQVKYFKEWSASSQLETFSKFTVADAIIIINTETEYASKLF